MTDDDEYNGAGGDLVEEIGGNNADSVAMINIKNKPRVFKEIITFERQFNNNPAGATGASE